MNKPPKPSSYSPDSCTGFYCFRVNFNNISKLVFLTLHPGGVVHGDGAEEVESRDGSHFLSQDVLN